MAGGARSQDGTEGSEHVGDANNAIEEALRWSTELEAVLAWRQPLRREKGMLGAKCTEGHALLELPR